MTPLTLTGLDGSNPLAFFAALGALVAVDEAAARTDSTAPTLHWTLDGVWRPTLTSSLDSEQALVSFLDDDRQRCVREPALRFTYVKEDKKKGSVDVPDLKASPEELRESLLTWVALSAPENRRTLDWFTGLVSEGAKAGNGAAKPTALHFSAGQQLFLKMACSLAEETTTQDIHEALLGPWRYRRELPVMGWDSAGSPGYALVAGDPSKNKTRGVPGADWLALRALLLFPTAPKRGRQRNVGVRGRWKSPTLTWPMWSTPLSRSTVSSTLALPNLPKLDPVARLRRGIDAIHQVQISRSDQGGYGSVSPATVL